MTGTRIRSIRKSPNLTCEPLNYRLITSSLLLPPSLPWYRYPHHARHRHRRPFDLRNRTTNSSRGLTAKLANTEIGVVVEGAVGEVDSTRTRQLVDPSTKAAHTLIQPCLYKRPFLKGLSPDDLLSHCLALLVLVNVVLVDCESRHVAMINYSKSRLCTKACYPYFLLCTCKPYPDVTSRSEPCGTHIALHLQREVVIISSFCWTTRLGWYTLCKLCSPGCIVANARPPATSLTFSVLAVNEIPSLCLLLPFVSDRLPSCPNIMYCISTYLPCLPCSYSW